MIPLYKLIEHSDNQSNIFGGLYRFWKDQPKYLITHSESFKFKSRFLNNSKNDGIRKSEIAASEKT